MIDMVRCLVCDKELKTKRGLFVHLNRIHKIHGPRARLSLKIAEMFFPLLEKKRWKKAKNILKQVKQNQETDEWTKGYIHALNGMISSLKMSDASPEPYIVKMNQFEDKRLREVKREFNDFSDLFEKKEFDAAYFKAWEDFTNYVIRCQRISNNGN